MDFQQLIINEMSDSQVTVWREQSPYVTSIGLNSFAPFAQKYKQYKNRLSEEQGDFNSAIKSASQNRDEAFRENQRRIACEHENQLAHRRRNKIIIIVFILAFVVICTIVSLVLFIGYRNNNITLKYTELEDGTLMVVGIDSGLNGDTLIVPETYDEKVISVIGKEAFRDNMKLKKVVLSQSIKEVQDEAFSGCTSLVEVSLNNIEVIGEKAFYECNSLNSITIPNSLKQIKSYAFANCEGLTVVYYNSVSCVDCDKQTNVFSNSGQNMGISLVIGTDVEYIPSYLFTSTYKTWNKNNEAMYRAMYQQYVGSQVAQGSYFGHTSNIMSFEQWVLNKYPYWEYSTTSINQIEFSSDSKCKSIGVRAFYKANIEMIILPATLQKIGLEAFGSCTELSYVTFEETLNWNIASDPESKLTFVSVVDPTQNAVYLTEIYNNFYWIKNQ